MSWISTWAQLRVLIILFLQVLLLKCGSSKPVTTNAARPFAKIIVPTLHTALSGDVTVIIIKTPVTNFASITNKSKTASKDVESIIVDDDKPIFNKTEVHHSLVLRVLLLDGLTSEMVGEIRLEYVPYKGENFSVIIPCGFFSRGGTYNLQLEYKPSTIITELTNVTDIPEMEMSSALEVKWPMPSLSLEPQHFTTYPNQSISAYVKYNRIACVPAKNVPVTQYVLQLIYCGSSVVSCDPQNRSRVQVLYFEEIKGFSTRGLTYNLRCELFGLVGNYALRLKPSDENPTAPTTSVYIKVELSDKYVFNVHAHSVYPCEDREGLSVLFEYPSCRLEGDRVRVYGRLRADVASLAPPSTLHYIAEMKAMPGKHILTFDCDIFTEKFIEYCFVYVNQAITGAMAQVKLTCIPTFPLQDNDVGGWGPWSPWTPCSTSCVGGTRNRYRFCDTPPPRYGARFCQGAAVETETCGGISYLNMHNLWNKADWECHHGNELAATRPEVSAEVGAKCRCGCVINFEENFQRKVLAASTQACPGRSFWLLQARKNFVVRFHLDQAKFPCPGQYFRARDGDSLSANLLTDVAFGKTLSPIASITSTKQSLLLEFFSDEAVAAGNSCVGGFLAHATMFHKPSLENATILAVPFEPNSTITSVYWLTPAHFTATVLLMIMFVISIFLAVQYAYKYRKYQIAEDLDTLADSSVYSGPLQRLSKRSRIPSSSTLISEVVSLVRLSRATPKHAKLETPSCDVEDGYESSETQAEYADESSGNSQTLQSNEREDTISDKHIIPNALGMIEDNSSLSSVVIIGQPEVKYARPVKLRTLESTGMVNTETPKNETKSENVGDISVDENTGNSYNIAELSPDYNLTSAPSFRYGKETKERRNRARLRQGPGSSEFNLTNSEVDLELDYYDYNVANASAVPGSYLGMDPAFLVWIPPFSSHDSYPLAISEGNCEEATIVGIEESGFKFNEGGTSLTPAEYRKFRASKTELSKSSKQPSDRLTKKSDSSETSSEDIFESRTKLCERLLPIHRILEDSRIRVSDESLSEHMLKDKNVEQTVIPNRLYDITHTHHIDPKITAEFSEKPNDQVEQSLPAISDASKYNPLFDRNTSNPTNALQVDDKHKRPRTSSSCNKNSPEMDHWNIPRQKGGKELHETCLIENKTAHYDQKAAVKLNNTVMNKKSQLDDDVTHGDTCKVSLETFNLINMHTRNVEYDSLNSLSENKKIIGGVNIPMMELSGRRTRSPVRVHKPTDNKNVYIVKEDLEMADYDVRQDMQETAKPMPSFYELIRESEDKIKFADEEEDQGNAKGNV